MDNKLRENINEIIAIIKTAIAHDEFATVYEYIEQLKILSEALEISNYDKISKWTY